MKNLVLTFLIMFIVSCGNQNQKETVEIEQKMELHESTAAIKERLTQEGFQIFDYVDEKTKDTVLMQQYFIAFLKGRSR